MDRRPTPFRRTLCAALLTAVAGVAGTAAPAHAAGPAAAPAVATDQAMTAAQQIARQQWGTAACGGQATIAWTVLAPGVNATSSWSNPVDAYVAPAENSACHVDFNALAQWDWPKLCTVVVHELGHLTGHPHSADPGNVMAPFYDDPLPACDTPGPGQPALAAAPAPSAPARAPAPPAAGTKSSTRSPRVKTVRTRAVRITSPTPRRAKARPTAKARRSAGRASRPAARSTALRGVALTFRANAG